MQMIYHSRKYDYVVGIDPDVEANGIGAVCVATRATEVKTLAFAEAYAYLIALRDKLMQEHKTFVVVVEASWLVGKTNWHLKTRDNRPSASAKGYSVGRNHQTGHDIVDMCRYAGIEVVEQTPLRKCWRGKDGKITHDELMAITGSKGRNNQEGRDALLLAWCYAELPIRIRM